MKQYYKTKLSAEDFAREFSLRSMSIEETIYLSEKYSGIIIAEIKEIIPHPNADKLKIAKTDIGNEIVEIVCGGSNIKESQKVIVALPGAKVKWHGEENWTELKPTKIRDIASHGMICAPEEIDLAKVPCGDHEIWDITNLIDSPAGTPFAEAFFANDILFDIEVTTNRPDSMSIIGLAREASVVSNEEFLWQSSNLPKTQNELPLSVKVENPELCPRYTAIAIDGVKVKPSPAWLQAKLLSSGHRPINNIVDITNYILHEYGQPLHAFDYEKVQNGEIIVRLAKNGERISALDEIEYELSEKDLLIADSENALSVAGVMGGLESGISDKTFRIILESATFDSISVRKTARSLNLYSDSQSMFEKGLSTESTVPALARAIEMILEIAGGEVASNFVDSRKEEYQPKVFTLNPERVRQQIGVEISDQEQITILENLGFNFEKQGEIYQVQVPYWRDNDIEDNVDLTEEIARIYGYANIKSELPVGTIPLLPKNSHLVLENWLKTELSILGFTEFFSFSFTNEKEMLSYNIDPKTAIQIHNPLTAEITHLRTSLIPSLLTSLSDNKKHTKQGKVFELSRIYNPRKDDLPQEISHLVLSQFGYQDALQSFRELKGVLDHIITKQGLKYELSRKDIPENWHQTRTASIIINDHIVGYIGEKSAEIKEAFDLEDLSFSVLQLDLSQLYEITQLTKTFIPFDESTKIERDISFTIDKKTEFASIANEITKIDSIQKLNLVDVYQGKGIEPNKQSLTIRLNFEFSQTPTSEEIESELKKAHELLAQKFSANIR